MEWLSELVKTISGIDSSFYILFTAIICAIFFVYAIFLSSQMRSLQRKYNILVKGSDKRNIGELFEEYFEKIDSLSKMKDAVQLDIEDAKALAAACLHHIGIVRYSAYQDVGGDLSFSLALLDGDYSGILVTSIFGRNESRTYAKPIIKAGSTYKLTYEEEEAIRRARLPRTVTRRGNKKN